MLKFFIFLSVVWIFCSKTIYAKVVINEFLIDASPQQVELYNTATASSNLSGWYIDDNGGNTYFTIPDNTIIYPQACLVFFGDFNLNKASADSIRLFDNSYPPTTSSAVLIDSFSYKAASGSASFFRYPDGENSWATGEATLGYFNKTRLNCSVSATPILDTPTPEPIPSPTEIPTPSPTVLLTLTPTSPSLPTNIFLSEVMVYPETGEKEWIELYNGNGFSVHLDYWYIDDRENSGSTPKVFSLTIEAHSFASFDLSTSLFNNDADSVRLLDPFKTEVDSFEYTKGFKNNSFSRLSFESDTFCTTTSTKNNQNSDCIEDSPIVKLLIPTQTLALPKILNEKSTINKKQNQSLSVSAQKKIYPTSVKSQKIIPKGEVLGDQTNYIPFDNQSNSPQILIKASTTSSISIAFLNIAFILFTMIRKIKFDNSFKEYI
jgi:hypothetical protein